MWRVAIDVNNGKYVGKSNRLEDAIVKTNTDAIREICGKSAAI